MSRVFGRAWTESLLAVLLATQSVSAHDAAHTELGFVPLVGGDSDVGIGVGQVSSIARFEPGYLPYRFRLETGAFVTFKSDVVPYQDYFATLTLPDVVPRVLRLELRPSYTREATVRYYGLGNASPPRDGALRDLEYTRTHPTMWVRARLTLLPNVLYLRAGAALTYNALEVPAGTRLARDIAQGLLEPARDSSLFLFEHAIVYDTRDHETSPTSGSYHALMLRTSPAGTTALPYRFAVLNAAVRFYTTPPRPHVTVAARAVADVQLGHPPFFDLSRYEDTPAIGGVNGVRGVPANRYYGQIKIFTNLEVRSELVRFHLFGAEMALGAATFIDLGRVWADTRRRPELDGTGLGLKYGIGGGLRLRQGQAFVVRADIAWSPDAEPISAYFAAGEIF